VPQRWAVALSALTYIAITAILGRDVLARLGSTIVNDEGDPLFVAAILQWNATTLPYTQAWWQFPIAHPTPDALAFSEHMLGVSVLATPIYWLTRDAVVTYNLVTLATFPLCALAMYALVFRLTRSAPGAFLAGLAFAFAPYRVSQLPHLQMLASFWAPLALLGLHAFVETGKRRWLALYAAAWLLQGAANGYALVFFSVLVGLWVLWFVVAAREWRALAMIAVATVVAALPLAPILAKYLAVHELHGFARDLAEIRSFSADLGAVFCAPGQLALWSWIRTACRPEGELFPGAALVVICALAFVRVVTAPAEAPTPLSRLLTLASRVLLVVGVVYTAIAISVGIGGRWRFDLGPLRLSASSIAKPVMVATASLVLAFALSPAVRGAARRSSVIGFYLVAGIACWALALGPTLNFMGEPRGIDAPFSLLLHVPGFDGLRVPARFWLMTVLCLSVVVGLSAATLLEGRSRAVRAVGVAIAACALVADGWIPRIVAAAVPPQVPDPASLRGAMVLELPMGSLRDIAAEYRAVQGGWRTVNVYTGYFPNYYIAMLDAARSEHVDVVVPFRALAPLHVVVSEEAPRLKSLIEQQPGVMVTARSAQATQYLLPRRNDVPNVERGGARVPVQSATASCSHAIAHYAIDGNDDTRWDCGPQRPNEEITFDLGRASSVATVVHRLGIYTGNFPRHLVIETSLDDSSWTPAWDGSVRGLLIAQALERPGATIEFAIPIAPRSARYVRLRQTSSDPAFPWSIGEIELWSGQ
jgi:hypothetical protein